MVGSRSSDNCCFVRYLSTPASLVTIPVYSPSSATIPVKSVTGIAPTVSVPTFVIPVPSIASFGLMVYKP